MRSLLNGIGPDPRLPQDILAQLHLIIIQARSSLFPPITLVLCTVLRPLLSLHLLCLRVLKRRMLNPQCQTKMQMMTLLNHPQILPRRGPMMSPPIPNLMKRVLIPKIPTKMIVARLRPRAGMRTRILNLMIASSPVPLKIHLQLKRAPL
eukprot:TRINITY_DN18593_c0_g1::TRINITY_DN18593_c0_g1_i1::g.1144::m.1144 TRINITY_DN18593_c0_g1::TRINITY_DN18593_c0_g1_i1::g.1144  ORF type:complete len:150 (-),score=-26.29,DUF4381/PF14316.1/0.61 TRINITY_DN18593_c0_g1_i1:269-718(-)